MTVIMKTLPTSSRATFPTKEHCMSMHIKLFLNLLKPFAPNIPFHIFVHLDFSFSQEYIPLYYSKAYERHQFSLFLFHTESKIIDLSQVVQMVWVPNDRTEAAHNNRSVSRGKRKSFLSAQFRLQRRQAKTRGTRWLSAKLASIEKRYTRQDETENVLSWNYFNMSYPKQIKQT